MNELYQRIKQGLQCLPPKDTELCGQFLKNRDFEKLRDIVESCLIMKKRDDHRDVHKDKWVNVDRGQLEQLTLDVREYTSYLDLSDISNDLDTYY